MSNSKRHHFIPVFYLKFFTDKDGCFFIYDVHKNQFKGKGRRFAPSSHFFEFYANTVFNDNIPSDFIEKGFSDYDSKVSNIFKRVSLSGSPELTSDEWTLLQYFINILYWRNPSNTNKVIDYIKRSKDISDFYGTLINVITDDKRRYDEENKLMTHPDFYKYAKYMLPAITYTDVLEKSTQDFATIFTTPETLPKLVSDNPIIYKNPGAESLHTDEFLFPLMPTKTLLRHKRKAINIHSYVRVYMDMLLLMQAKSYVACTDKSYPLLLKEYYKKEFSSIEALRERVFGYIFEAVK